MLKKRIEKIESNFGLSKFTERNTDAIYQFFQSADESVLPEELSFAETKRAMSNGIENCPGLLKAFKILKEENEFDNESDFLDYIKANNYPVFKVITTSENEEIRGEYWLLERLNLISILHIKVVETRKK